MDTFPLFVPLNAHQKSHMLLSHSFSIYREIGWAHARWAIFFFSGTILSMGQCRFISRWLSALWGPELPSIQRSLDRLISGQCKIFESVSHHFMIWGSNRFEYVISSLSVPWILGVSFHLLFQFQIHTHGEIYLLAFWDIYIYIYIYMSHGRGSNNNPLRLKLFASLV